MRERDPVMIDELNHDRRTQDTPEYIDARQYALHVARIAILQDPNGKGMDDAIVDSEAIKEAQHAFGDQYYWMTDEQRKTLPGWVQAVGDAYLDDLEVLAKRECGYDD